MHYVYMFQNYMLYLSFENATSAVYERQVAKVSNFSLYYFFSSFFYTNKSPAAGQRPGLVSDAGAEAYIRATASL